MSDYQSLNHRHFFSKLSKYARNGFTGRLNIKIENLSSWRIYFNTGSIIWASGGLHPVRPWLRQLKGCKCQVTIPQDLTKEELLSSRSECWDYLALVALMQESYLNSEQIKYIVEGAISEVLFDIVQALAQVSPEEVDQIKMLRKEGVHPCDQDLLLLAWMWRTEGAKQRILVTWHSWVATGLTYYSPNAGLIANQEELKAQKLNSLAQYFLEIDKKEKTLRDLAVENQKNVLSILRTMKGYFNQNLIRFKSVPDLWEEARKQLQSSSHGHQGQLTGLMRKRHSEEISGISGDFNQQEEGVRINVMEFLVAREAERQLEAFSPAQREQISKLDVITHALNRLPPLYAASKEGIAYQTKQAREKHEDAIKLAVQRGISVVKENPLRSSTRISSQDQFWS